MVNDLDLDLRDDLTNMTFKYIETAHGHILVQNPFYSIDTTVGFWCLFHVIRKTLAKYGPQATLTVIMNLGFISAPFPSPCSHLFFPCHLSFHLGLHNKMRVCCYGSSSSNTPERYMAESYKLGTILSERGHTCVNGAGRTGCMGAMNDGVNDSNGHVIGVIHEMFLTNSSSPEKPMGDENDGAHLVFRNTNERNNPLRKLYVAGGKDLQERKRMLVENADCLCVLPGGCGTWDELWEMACSKALGLITIPIVVVNVDGFYSPFRDIMVRAFNEKLLYQPPDEIIRFESSAETAVDWLETRFSRIKSEEQHKRSRPHLSSVGSRVGGVLDEYNDNREVTKTTTLFMKLSLAFACGIIIGSSLTKKG